MQNLVSGSVEEDTTADSAGYTYTGTAAASRYQEASDDRSIVAEQYGFEPTGEVIDRSAVPAHELEDYVLTVLEGQQEVTGERVEEEHITQVADRYDEDTSFSHMPVYGNTMFYGTHPDKSGMDRREADIVALIPEDEGIVARYIEVKSFREGGVEKAKEQLETFAAYAEEQGWQPTLEAAFWDQDAIYRYRFDPDAVEVEKV